MKKFLKLYLVTDRRYHPDTPLEIQVEAAIKGGVTCVQIREKNLSEEDLINLSKRVHKITTAHQIPLIINDFPLVAKAVGAEGVHIGQEDGAIQYARTVLGPDAIIGVTAKTVEQAVSAAKSGADYLGVGALFPSPTKNIAEMISHDTYTAIRQSVDIPIVAIGGIQKDNLEDIKNLDFDGIAVVSAVLNHEDIQKATQHLNQALEAIL